MIQPAALRRHRRLAFGPWAVAVAVLLGACSGAEGGHDTPADIESLLLADLPAAQQWRLRQRQAFASLPDGWTVTGIDPDGRYQVEFP